MVHHGTGDVRAALNTIDNAPTLSTAFRRFSYLLNCAFRQPPWLRSNTNLASKRRTTSNSEDGTVSTESLVKLEERWLGLHSEKYAQRRAHLDFWNMFGVFAHGRLVEVCPLLSAVVLSRCRVDIRCGWPLCSSGQTKTHGLVCQAQAGSHCGRCSAK